MADLLLACAACSQEMRCDDDGTLPLHEAQGVVCVGSYGQGQPSRGGPIIVAPFVPAQIDQRAALEALNSRTCWNCGQPKRQGKPFDKHCWKALVAAAPSVEAWINCYRGVGGGFEQAFANALTMLREARAAAEAAKVPLFSVATGEESMAAPGSTL